jgi:hypothetical protein
VNGAILIGLGAAWLGRSGSTATGIALVGPVLMIRSATSSDWRAADRTHDLRLDLLGHLSIKACVAFPSGSWPAAHSVFERTQEHPCCRFSPAGDFRETLKTTENPLAEPKTCRYCEKAKDRSQFSANER